MRDHRTRILREPLGGGAIRSLFLRRDLPAFGFGRERLLERYPRVLGREAILTVSPSFEPGVLDRVLGLADGSIGAVAACLELRDHARRLGQLDVR